MSEIDRMIAEAHELCRFYCEQTRRGVSGASEQAADYCLRETTLLEAKLAIENDNQRRYAPEYQTKEH